MIKQWEPLLKRFPDGPKQPLGTWVDIVAISPEGRSLRANSGWPLTGRPTVQEAVAGRVGELPFLKSEHHLLAATEQTHSSQIGQEERSKDIRGAPSPSDCVKSSAAVKKALTDPRGHSPRYGRPSDQFGPPTALFSKPLALFEHDLKNLKSFTPDAEVLGHAFEFVAGATEIYENEKDREKFLYPLLEHLLPGECKWKESIAKGSAKVSDKGGAKPDGLWLEGRFPCLIFELKNEQGLGGDPFLQGLIVYGKIVAQEEVRLLLFPLQLLCH